MAWNIIKRHSQFLLGISVSYLSEGDGLLESSLSVPGAFFMTQLGALQYQLELWWTGRSFLFFFSELIQSKKEKFFLIFFPRP